MRERDLCCKEKAGARKACKWLVDVPSSQITAEQQIQRIFAVSAFAATDRAGLGDLSADLRKLAAELPEFAWHQCPGDPFFAVATHRLLALANVQVDSLGALANGLHEILFGIEQNAAATPLWGSLLVTNGSTHVGAMPPDTALSLETLFDGQSEIVVEICRTLMHRSACGTIPIPASQLHIALPMLCVSYARSFDIQAVCRLLRACAYLGVAESIECRWAREWLLFQQQRDGRFGLLDLEAQRAGWNLDGMNLYFLPTVEAVWTLAELACAGVLLTLP